MRIKKRLLIYPTIFALIGAVVVSLILPFRMVVSRTGAIISIAVNQAHAAPIEIVSKRTQNSKTYDLGTGQFSLDVSLAPVHYKDTGNNWQEIDNSFVAGTLPVLYTMNKASYTLNVLATTFNGGKLIEFVSGGQSVGLQPSTLQWNSDTGQTQLISNPVAVVGSVVNRSSNRLSGNISGNSGTITWTNAYGTGRSFEWSAGPNGIEKILTINAASNIPTPPTRVINGGNPVVQLSMIFTPSVGTNIYVNGTLWNKTTTVTTSTDIEFRDTIGNTLWYFPRLRYWDSGGNMGYSPATLRNVSGILYIDVKVPRTWLQTAVYPVYIDTNVDKSVAASANDGWGRSSDSTMYPVYDNTYAGCLTYYCTSWFRFTGITIPQSSTISSAYWRVYEMGSTASALTKVYFVDANDPAAPTTYAELTGFTLTTNNIDWDGDPGANGWYNSASLVSLVQELVTSYDYSNEAMEIIHKDDGSANNQNQRWYQYDKSGGIYASELHIVYSSDPVITVSPTTYDFGTVNPSATPYTTTSYFTIDNTSTMQTDQTIAVTSATWAGGVTWTHSDTATPGANTAGLLANKGGTWGVSDVIVKFNSPNYIAENQAANTDYSFGLKLLAPTSFTDGVQKSNTVRVSAVAG